jgi:hypothetical protein
MQEVKGGSGPEARGPKGERTFLKEMAAFTQPAYLREGDCLNMSNSFQLPRLERSQGTSASHFPLAVGDRRPLFLKEGVQTSSVISLPFSKVGVCLPCCSVLAGELLWTQRLWEFPFAYSGPR